MKKFLRLSILTMIMLCFAGITKSQTPIGHWPLDANANDIIGGKNGTVVGGVQFVNDPVRGDVAYFDGAGGVINLPSLLWGDTTQIKSIISTTISCWFNWEGGADWQRIFSLGKTDGAWKNMYLSVRDGWDGHGLHLTYHVLTPVDTWYDFVGEWNNMDFDTVTPNTWYHAALILDGDSVAKAYINGVKIVDEDSVYVTPDKIQYKDSSNNVIGASHWPDPTFMGMIDDFRIYGEALTDAEVVGLFNGVDPTKINENTTSPSINFYSVNGRILNANSNEINISKISVYSITGKLLFSTKHLPELKSKQFTQGLYLVTVESDTEIYTSKVLIK